MIKGLHHVGLEVADLEKSIDYYQDFGFELVGKFNYEEAELQGAMLRSRDLGGIELFKFNNHDHEMVEKVKKHIAYETDNIDEDLKKFLDSGYELAIPLRNGKIVKKYAYVKDSFGNYIELLEI